MSKNKNDELNMDWLDDGLPQTDEKTSSSGGSFQNVLVPKYNGIYVFRFMPAKSELELFRPVGFHWNIGGRGNTDVPPVVCPHYTIRIIEGVVYTNKQCPVCDGINTLIAKGKARYRDFAGKDGCQLQKVFFSRVYFTEFIPEKGSGEKELPDFGELPVQKILQIPYSAMPYFKDHIKNPKNKPKKTVFDPDTGRLFALKRTHDGTVKYSGDKYEEECELPEELRNIDNYIDIDACIPDYSTEDILEILQEYSHAWPELSKIALSNEKLISASDGADDHARQLADI